MLILAGVSLNALVGDNGIITNSMDAKMKNGMAALEEWLQQKYVENYDDAEKYESKPELINAKVKGFLLKDGTRNYVINNGKAYYLINKKSLPKEIQEQLIGGNSTEYSQYIRLYDVYGVTNDLKVYYIDNQTNTRMGEVADADINPLAPVEAINNSDGIKSAVTAALADVGITVDPDKGVTYSDINSLKSFTLDGSEYSITDIESLSELRGLKELTLKNVCIQNLKGIESMTFLNYIKFIDCIISDYSALESCWELTYLYIQISNQFTEIEANNEVNLICDGLKNANNITKLQYFGVFSEDVSNISTLYFYDTYGASSNNWACRTIATTSRNKVSDISCFEKIAMNIRNSVTYMYLQGCSLTEISVLNKFSNIAVLYIFSNSIETLDGLENHKQLTHLIAQDNMIEDIDGLIGCTNLYWISLRNNLIENLDGLKDSYQLRAAWLCYNNISDIKGLILESEEGNTNLFGLFLENNTNLINVLNLGKLTGLRQLCLKNNLSLSTDDLSDTAVRSVFLGCGTNLIIDVKYSLLFLDSAKVNLADADLTDESLRLLKDNTKITDLNISSNSDLSDETVNEVLTTLSQLKKLDISYLENVTSLDFIESMPILQTFSMQGTGITDFSILETLAENDELSVRQMTVGHNINANITGLQKTINYISERVRANDNTEDLTVAGLNYINGGVIIVGADNQRQLANCSDLESYRCYYSQWTTIKDLAPVNGNLGVLDLSSCSKLKTYSVRSISFKIKTNNRSKI